MPEPSESRPHSGTIRDVARAAGVSIATVSRVMSGRAKVRAETRQRVEAACQQVGYVPNPAARALSTNRSRVVAAIIPTIEHSVFAKFVAALERHLADHGYALVLATTQGDRDREVQAARRLIGMGAEAFVLSGLDHAADLGTLLQTRQIPHVATSVWDPSASMPTIGYDNAALAWSAIRHLQEHGHQQIAVIHGPVANNDRTRARLQGLRHMLDVALTCREVPVSAEGGKAGLREVLDQHPGTTAVLCFSDVLALGVYFGAAEAGLSIPHDLSVMGFDNLDWAEAVVPPLTTLDLPAEAMGAAAAEQLVRALENGLRPEPFALQARILSRGSVVRPRARRP